MMGAMIQLGRGDFTLDHIAQSLKEGNDHLQMDYSAPASGLILNDMHFE